MGRARDIANATTSATVNAVVKRDGSGLIPANRPADIQTFSAAGTATWTKPSTGSVAFIQVWGAGGGGGNAQTSVVAGGGGGGGGNTSSSTNSGAGGDGRVIVTVW